MFWGSIFTFANIGFIVFIIVGKMGAMPKPSKLMSFENAYRAKSTKVNEYKESFKKEQVYRSYGYVINIDKKTSKYSLDFIGSI